MFYECRNFFYSKFLLFIVIKYTNRQIKAFFFHAQFNLNFKYTFRNTYNGEFIQKINVCICKGNHHLNL